MEAASHHNDNIIQREKRRHHRPNFMAKSAALVEQIAGVVNNPTFRFRGYAKLADFLNRIGILRINNKRWSKTAINSYILLHREFFEPFSLKIGGFTPNVALSASHKRKKEVCLIQVAPVINNVANLKYSYHELADILNSHGLKTIRGRVWTHSIVRDVIDENPERFQPYLTHHVLNDGRGHVGCIPNFDVTALPVIEFKKPDPGYFSRLVGHNEAVINVFQYVDKDNRICQELGYPFKSTESADKFIKGRDMKPSYRLRLHGKS